MVPPPDDVLGKVIYYANRFSKLFNRMVSSLGGLGVRFSEFLKRVLQLPGFRQVSNVVYTLLLPFYQTFNYIYTSVVALNKFEGGFLSILIFVVASFLGNFLGTEWYVLHLF